MQRANASSKPSTPISEPAAKRIRTDTGYTPGTSATNTPTSEKRLYFPTPAQTQASPLQTYQSSGVTETQWIIASSVPHESPPQQPLATEHAEADSEEESNARQTYGNFKRKRRVTTTAAADNAHHGAAYSIRPLSEDEADSVDEDLDSDDEDNDDNDDEAEDDEHANSRAATRRRKAAAMSGEDLDRIDLRQSQYTKSKGTLNPHGGGGNSNGSGKNNSNKKVYNKRGANAGKKAGRQRQTSRKRPE